jgi:hypothetical protein
MVSMVTGAQFENELCTDNLIRIVNLPKIFNVNCVN